MVIGSAIFGSVGTYFYYNENNNKNLEIKNNISTLNVDLNTKEDLFSNNKIIKNENNNDENLSLMESDDDLIEVKEDEEEEKIEYTKDISSKINDVQDVVLNDEEKEKLNKAELSIKNAELQYPKGFIKNIEKDYAKQNVVSYLNDGKEAKVHFNVFTNEKTSNQIIFKKTYALKIKDINFSAKVIKKMKVSENYKDGRLITFYWTMPSKSLSKEIIFMLETIEIDRIISFDK